MTAKVLSLQKGWRWCRKCEGLFFIGNFFKWRCPAEGLHDHNGSGFYQLQLAPPGQPYWRRCRKCEGLFFNANLAAVLSFGRCPVAGGGNVNIHEPVLQTEYFLNINNFFGGLSSQSGWRWCQKCEGIFFSGNATNGRCAAGGSHNGLNSGNYNLLME